MLPMLNRRSAVVHPRASSTSAVEDSNRKHAALRVHFGWSDFWLIVGGGFYLLLNLFNFHGIPFLLGGDQAYFWVYAQRLLAGERIYRDFFQFPPPGADLVYFAAFRLFGPQIWIPNLIVMLLGVILCWVCFRIGLAFLTRHQAMLAAFLFLVVLYGKLINATHHWFSELAVLGAVAILLQGRTTRRLAIAGVLLGAATFFTQTRGPMAAAGIVAFLAWETYDKKDHWLSYFKKTSVLAVPMIASWAALSSYFIVTIGFRELWYWQVSYVTHYRVTGPRTLGLPSDLIETRLGSYQQYLVYLLIPVMYAVSLWLFRGSHCDATREVTSRRLLLTLAGLATAVEVAQSPNWLRVYCVAAPAIILLVWFADKAGILHRFLMGLMWVVVVCLAIVQIRGRHREQSQIVHIPTGTVASNRISAARLEWVAAHTHPGDFFFQAAWPGLYFPLQLRNPVFAGDFMPNDLTQPDLVADSIRQVDEKQVRYILWEPRLNSPLEPEHPETYHLAPFRDYMSKHYRRVYLFADQQEIWERI